MRFSETFKSLTKVLFVFSVLVGLFVSFVMHFLHSFGEASLIVGGVIGAKVFVIGMIIVLILTAIKGVEK